ncbi:50S ribosomal protein L19 [Patescibacteria group bacterium]|nr:50S ribosomal protein L19 [Patescibacteria group bacterium]
MSIKTEIFIKPFLKENLSDVRPGDLVKVYQKIPASAKASAVKKATAGKKEEDKEKTHVFEGVVLARKHGKGISSTITVRKVVGGIGIERIFPLYLPTIEKIEILKRGKVRRAKLYYLRERVGKKARLKKKEKKTKEK